MREYCASLCRSWCVSSISGSWQQLPHRAHRIFNSFDVFPFFRMGPSPSPVIYSAAGMYIREVLSLQSQEEYRRPGNVSPVMRANADRRLFLKSVT